MQSPFIVLIPARYQSTRFPGKPLALIDNREMILHVVDKAVTVTDKVYVATDDDRIARVVERAGYMAIMTAPHHTSGTERCAEAVQKLQAGLTPETVIVNLQGDEPLINPKLITDITKVFEDPGIHLATLIHRIDDQAIANNPNRVKVVLDDACRALYFSRALIPHPQNALHPYWFLHIGMYAYRLKSLLEIVRLPESFLERTESLEQLRWLENGYHIHCLESSYMGHGIDTPDDLINLQKK